MTTNDGQPEMDTPRWYKFLRRVGHLRPTIAWGVSVFWYLFGGICTLLVMRLIVVDQLKAETITRATVDSTISVKVDKLAVKIDTLSSDQLIHLRAVCLDHTLGEQALIGVTCPRHLYKGAK